MNGTVQSSGVRELALRLWRSGAAFYREAAGHARSERCQGLLLKLADWEEQQAQALSQAPSLGGGPGMAARPLQPLLWQVQDQLYDLSRQRLIAKAQDDHGLLLQVLYLQDLVGFLIHRVVQASKDVASRDFACEIIEQHIRYVMFLHQQLTLLEEGYQISSGAAQDQSPTELCFASSLRA